MMSVHPYMDKYKVLFAYIVLEVVKYYRSCQVACAYLLFIHALCTPLFLCLIVCSPILWQEKVFEICRSSYDSNMDGTETYPDHVDIIGDK